MDFEPSLYVNFGLVGVKNKKVVSLALSGCKGLYFWIYWVLIFVMSSFLEIYVLFVLDRRVYL